MDWRLAIEGNVPGEATAKTAKTATVVPRRYQGTRSPRRSCTRRITGIPGGESELSSSGAGRPSGPGSPGPAGLPRPPSATHSGSPAGSASSYQGHEEDTE